jgi:hypothetical protein
MLALKGVKYYHQLPAALQKQTRNNPPTQPPGNVTLHSLTRQLVHQLQVGHAVHGRLVIILHSQPRLTVGAELLINDLVKTSPAAAAAAAAAQPITKVETCPSTALPHFK